MTANKKEVFDFWNKASCGEDLYLHNTQAQGYVEQARMRYQLEPYIFDFAKFSESKGKRVLEIGVGLGADHQQFAQAGAELFGVDLTARAVEHTQKRLKCFGLQSTIAIDDAENLSFPNDTFDIVYSWGVLHHSPNTPKAISEVWRVLKPGAVAKIMIYSKWSVIGAMLWTRYALLQGKPWLSLTEIYDRYLESPGTKAYTISQAKQLMSSFENVRISTVLTHGDLLSSQAGQRHAGLLLRIARAVWPRWLIQTLFPTAGLFMLIEGSKPTQ